MIKFNWLFWSLGSALFAGVTAILAKLGVEQVPPNLATAIRSTVAVVFAWSLAFTAIRPLRVERISSQGWTFLILSGIATGLSWVCYFQALSTGLVSRVMTIDRLSIIFGLALAVLFLGERIQLKEGLGIAFIILGTLIMVSK
jgi:transporter family protein